MFLATGTRDGGLDTGLTAGQADELGTATDSHAQPAQMILENHLKSILRDEHTIRVASAPWPGVQRYRQAREVPAGGLGRDAALDHRVEQSPHRQYL